MSTQSLVRGLDLRVRLIELELQTAIFGASDQIDVEGGQLHMDAESMGYSDYAADADCSEPPLLEGTFLLSAWRAGFNTAESFEIIRECHQCGDPEVLLCSFHD